jgi:hypothetical protein
MSLPLFVFGGLMGKGGDFERDIAKFFTKWLTGKEKPYKYWRQDASGGLATIHRENVHMSGDICSLARDADFLTDIFSIECKTGYPKTSFWQHFIPTKFTLEEFWKQCVKDAPENKSPMLIYRKLRRKPIIGINSNIQDKISDLVDDLNTILIKFNHELDNIWLYDLDDFFERVKPENLKNINRNRLDYGNFEFDT